MGGFVAILQTNGAAIDPRLLQDSLDVAPFDSGRAQLWTAQGVGLCAAPLDSPHDQAPHSFTRNRLNIVIDARLDDREALVRRLEAEVGRPFTTASDVELVLGAYERWGTGCAAHLLGDFSFCLWDADSRQLFCARDHLGVKPLYYARVGATLIVSNVLHSIRRHPRVSARLDDYAVGDLLLVGACMYPSRTSFAGIARVPPAHTLRCSGSSPTERVERYWSLTPGNELRLRDPREYVDAYVSVLDTVVRDRLRDAPVGMLLSGGLDSSSVAAAAAGVVGHDAAADLLRAYTFVYDTVAEDEERQYSSVVARHLGVPIEHHPLDRYRWFERWNSDLLPPEPSTEPMTAMMADLLQRVAGHSAMALTGDGGDPALLPSSLVRLLRHRAPHLVMSDFARSLWQTGSLPPIGLRAMVRQWLARRADDTIPVWLSDGFVQRCDLRARRVALADRGTEEGPRGPAARSIADLWWASMFETYDPGATRRPVTLRYPLLDVRFVTFALSLPTHPWCVNKMIVRTAMRGRLPDEICARPKSPLAVDPFQTHGRVTKTDIAADIEAAPELQSYIDLRRFTESVRDDRVMTDEEPGTWAAAALATWIRCSAFAFGRADRMP